MLISRPKTRGQLRALSFGPFPVGAVALVLTTILSTSMPSSRSQTVIVCSPAGISSVPGDDFHLTGGENTFRLNFSNATPDKIREGVRRLATLLADQLQKNPPEKIPAGAVA